MERYYFEPVQLCVRECTNRELLLELVHFCVPYSVGVVRSHLFLLPVLTPTSGNGTQFGRQDQCISEVTSQVVITAIAIWLVTL